MIEKTKKSYGGFLPLELKKGQEWFDKYEQKCMAFNSVKAGLAYLLESKNITNVWLPYYYCPSTIQAIRNLGIQVDFYHIDENLLPEKKVCAEYYQGAVILVNYFGIVDGQVKSYMKKVLASMIILDQAHSFYAEPVMSANVFNLYSAKKFFGITDGAYLIGEEVNTQPQIPFFASEHIHYLSVAFEKGTNAAYEEKKKVDAFLANNYGGMSIISHGLLQNIDYNQILECRKKNFSVLLEEFKNINLLKMLSSYPAYVFPLLLDDGEKIKKRLIEEKIFVPRLWNGKELLEKGNTFELNISSNGIFLPIDQRYENSDMCYIAKKVKEILNENT